MTNHIERCRMTIALPVEWEPVAAAILGSWPGTITRWGTDAFTAYLGELQARGLTPERVVLAVRTWPAGSDFPPSAPNLAAAARVDPTRPTFVEACALIYGRGGILRARPRTSTFADMADRQRAYREAQRARAATFHPLVESFAVDRYGLDRLAALEIDHPEWGEKKRAELERAWDAHLVAMEGRETLALVSGRRGDGLGRLDPLAVLESRRPGSVAAWIGAGGEP